MQWGITSKFGVESTLAVKKNNKLRGSIEAVAKCLEREHTRVFNVSHSLSLIDAVGITSEFGVESTCGRDKKPICLEEA